MPRSGLAGPLPPDDDRGARVTWSAATLRTALLSIIATLLAVLVVQALTDAGPQEVAASSGGPTTGFAVAAAGSVGADDAPVVMEVWSDFSCPYCGRFAIETQPSLLATYAESGQVRFEFHDFPVQGKPSLDAAIAARAAGRQGAYLAYADLLYEHQHQFGRAQLLTHAETLGLDLDEFERDLEDRAIEAAVRADWLAGQQAGVRATPSFVIDRQLVAGAQPIEQFRAFIDHFLGASS